jgi:protein-disulfide isomerase
MRLKAMRRLLPAFLLLPVCPLAPLPPAAAQGLTEAQRGEVVEILRRALREDPSILRDAIAALQEAEDRARAEAGRAAMVAQANALFRDAAAPTRGNPRGDVTIVEFFDARCGFCKQLHPSLEALIRRDGNVRVVMMDLPVLGPTSVQAARALLAAHRQGRYAALQDALLTHRGEPTEPVLRDLAQRIGLDWARLRRDMDDPAIARRIEANTRLAQSLGIQGTPALVIAGPAGPAGATLVPGAVDLAQLERLVAEARARR